MYSKSSKNRQNLSILPIKWSCWADSNCRPHPYQGCALPTELQQQEICPFERGILATTKGLEPSTSGVTGRRSNRLNYMANLLDYNNKRGAVCQALFSLFCKSRSETAIAAVGAGRSWRETGLYCATGCPGGQPAESNGGYEPLCCAHAACCFALVLVSTMALRTSTIPRKLQRSGAS